MRGGDRFRGQRPHHRRVVIEHENDEPFVMSRESKILEKAMSDVGYECVQLDVYKATWSSPGGGALYIFLTIRTARRVL
jgi:hypothetical protein